jgi:hypothetical protein
VGQTLIGCYTVPRGYTAYILSVTIGVESGKPATVHFYRRLNANDTTTPYSPMRIQNWWSGLDGVTQIDHKTHESYPEYTDIGFMAYVSSTSAAVSVDFEMLLVANQ